MPTETTLGFAPYAVAAGPDGTLWMTAVEPAGLARLTPDGELTVEPAGPGTPMQLSVTGDAVWYTRSDDRIARRTAAGTELFALPAGAAPYGIAAGDDGGAWFTASGTDQLGRITGQGAITLIDLPLPQSRAAMLTLHPDGTPWAALNGAAALARVDDAAAVHVIGLPEGSAPVGICAGPDGVWFADIAAGRAGLLRPDGELTLIPLGDPACRPHAVATDPDGGCWVTLWGSGGLARITATGDVTIRTLPGREPHGLAVTDRHVHVAMESGILATVDR